MIRVVTNYSFIPTKHHSRIAILDYTNTGDVAFYYDYTPQTAKDIPYTTYELTLRLHANNKEGSIEYYNRLLKGNADRLVLFIDYDRSLSLHNIAISNKLYNSDDLLTKLKEFLSWLKQKDYKTIYIVRGLMKTTALNQIIEKAINSI